MRNNGLPNVGREATALIYFLTQHSVVRMGINAAAESKFGK